MSYVSLDRTPTLQRNDDCRRRDLFRRIAHWHRMWHSP